MDRAWKSGAGVAPPPTPGSFSTGYASSGDPVNSIASTKPGAWWYHMITEELRGAIVAAGDTPDATRVDQIAQALVAYLSGSTYSEGTIRGEVQRRIVYIEDFGTWAAGVHSAAMIQAAIDFAYTIGGGEVRTRVPGRVYSVDPSIAPVKIRSGVVFNGVTRGSKIKRIGTNTTANLVQNYTYNPGSGNDTQVHVWNWTLEGNGTNVAGTQDHTAVGGCLAFYGVDCFSIRNCKFDQANSNGLMWRQAHNGVVDHCEGGSFGANLFAPTSGLNNRITNSNFDFAGLTGASPGECVDIENNSAAETSSTFWNNVRATSITFTDFWTTAGNAFAHEAQFENCSFTGGSPRTFRVIATNALKAKNFNIGSTCRIGVTNSSASALQIGSVANIICDAVLANDSGATGTTRAMELTGPVDNFTFDGVLAGPNTFNNGLDATNYALTNSKFLDAVLSNVILGSSSAANDFGGCTIANLTVSGAGSANNRFRQSTIITGTKTFSSGATWAGQYFEREQGTFTPAMSGSTTAGAGTYSAQIGSYTVSGDYIDFSAELTWSAHTGTGNIRVDLSNLPAAPAANTRWTCNVVTDITRTDSYVAMLLSGSSLVGDLRQMPASGALNAIPMDTSSSVYVSGRFRFR